MCCCSQKMSISDIFLQRALVLKTPLRFRLVDLRGKVVSRFNLSEQHKNGNVTFSLPAKLGKGIYVARFEGVSGIEQAKITITK